MQKYKTPKGIAHYPSLIRADTRFNPEGTYKTGLILSKEAAEELQQMAEEVFIEEFGKKKLTAAVKFPWKEQDEEQGDGVIFNTKSNKQPKFFDAKGNPIKNLESIEKLGGGSTLRLKGAMKAYNAGGATGVTMYLNEVQVINYVEYNGGGFEADDEGDFVAEDKAEKTVNEVAEEDIDF